MRAVAVIRIASLKNALRKYAKHGYGCHAHCCSNCTCGLSTVLMPGGCVHTNLLRTERGGGVIVVYCKDCMIHLPQEGAGVLHG